MPLPSDLTFRPIRGTYYDPDGSLAVGNVTFKQPLYLADILSKVGITAGDIVFPLVNGAFSDSILTADSAALDRQLWTYEVSENFPGGRGTFQYLHVIGDGSPIDLPVVEPSPFSPGIYMPPTVTTSEGYVRA